MSLKNKIFSIITVGAGVVVLSTAAFAQDDKTTAPAAPQKAERRDREKGDLDHGKFGRGERHGREGLLGKRMGREGRMGGGHMIIERSVTF